MLGGDFVNDVGSSLIEIRNLAVFRETGRFYSSIVGSHHWGFDRGFDLTVMVVRLNKAEPPWKER